MNFLCALYNDAVSHRTATQCRLQPVGYGFRKQQETCLFSETSISDVFLGVKQPAGTRNPSGLVSRLRISGDTPLLPIYASKTGGGTHETLLFIMLHNTENMFICWAPIAHRHDFYSV